MKRRSYLLVLIALCVMLLPSFSMAETEWHLTEKTLYHTEEVNWISVSPNGTYLLGIDWNAEETHSSLVLYDMPKHKQHVITWQVAEENEAYVFLRRIFATRSFIDSIDIVWSANEEYFTIADYDLFAQSTTGVNILCIGNITDKTLSVPYVWEHNTNRDGGAAVVNASFAADTSALYFTLANNGVFSERFLIIRYDLQTGSLTPWLSAAGTTSDGTETQFDGRNMVAASDSVFLMIDTRQGELVIANKVDDEWKYQYSLGIRSEAHHSVQKIQFSPESGKGILLCRDHTCGGPDNPYGGQNPVLYTFSLNEQGNLLSLELVHKDGVYNAILSPNGHAALLVLRSSNTLSYLSMLNLDNFSFQTVIMPLVMRDSDVLEQLYFNVRLSRWINGCYWGGEYLLTPLYEQQVFVMESDIAETVCRNRMYQPPEKIVSAVSPVGVYNLTKAVYFGEEVELGPEDFEVELILQENGSVTLEGYAFGEEGFLSGTWSLDGELLLIDFGEQNTLFVVSDHEGYTKLLFSIDEDVAWLFEP